MTAQITLIPFTTEHVRQTYIWIQDEELRKLFLMRGELTWEKHVAYFNNVLADPSQRVYAIIADRYHVGNCGFKNILSSKQTGELWIYIGEPSLRGQGAGKRSTELMLKKGFDTISLKTIYVHVADFNRRALSLYRNLGFIEVPLQHDADEWKGRDCTIIRMELTRE